jgi:hypothetical protein
MVSEDELRLGADAYLAKLLDSQTKVDRIWNGIKIATVAISLVGHDIFVRMTFSSKCFKTFVVAIGLSYNSHHCCNFVFNYLCSTYLGS